MVSARLLIIFVFAASTFANCSDLNGRQVRYVAGSFEEMQIGCTGRLDVRDSRELLVICGETRLVISNSAIVIARIVKSRKDADELNIKVPIFLSNKRIRLVYIGAITDRERKDWIVLEMSAKYARDVVVLLNRMKENRDGDLQNPQN